jgi:hypothetical protein
MKHRQLSLTAASVRLRREAGADRHNAALFWTSHSHLKPQTTSCHIKPTSCRETTVYRLHCISPPLPGRQRRHIQLLSSRRVQRINQSPTYPSSALTNSCPTGKYKRHCCVIVRHSTRTGLHCGRLCKQGLRQQLHLHITAHTHLPSPWPQLMSQRDHRPQRDHPSGALLPLGSSGSQA